MLIRPQIKHIRQLVKLCDNYHAMSRFKDESPIEEDNLHDFFKAIITRPTVFFEVLEIEDKIHGLIIGAFDNKGSTALEFSGEPYRAAYGFLAIIVVLANLLYFRIPDKLPSSGFVANKTR